MPLLAAWAGADAAWLVFTEIHYRPPVDDRLEFIELYNTSAPHAVLDGWRIDGEVAFHFPEGTTLRRGECAIVARDPSALRACHAGLVRVFGPFTGRLDDDGGRLVLRDRNGVRMAEMRYGRGGRWSPVADGTGHSLELSHPFLDPLAPESWRPSTAPGGSPGRVDLAGALGEVEVLVESGASWRYFPGRRTPPASWTEVSFDDSSWDSGPGGFGFGDGDDGTVLADMRGNYLAIFTRKTFRAPAPERGGRLVLRCDYDDGFVAYLNGREVARANMGEPGSRPDFKTVATGFREVGRVAEFDLGPSPDLLHAGENVLAVQVHNHSLASSDVSLIVSLERHRGKRSTAVAPRLNEVGFTPRRDPPGLRLAWVELYNPGFGAVPVQGYTVRLLTPHRDRTSERVVSRTEIPAGEVVASYGDFGTVAASGELRIVLVHPSGRVVDLLRLSAPGAAGGSLGRFPDGAGEAVPFPEASPGALNRPPPVPRLVINEIMYHPRDDSEAHEYVELFNPGPDRVDLGGFRLAGGIAYRFGDGTVLDGRSYLVVARNPDALRRHHPGLEEVAGPFRGRLSDRGERVALIDARQCRVDEVRYADRRPWPLWADGFGSSLELIHESFDNSLAGSWSASDESRHSRWQSFRYTKRLEVPRIGAPTHVQLLVLGEGECLVDDFALTDETGTVIFRDDFSRQTERWIACGTHDRSSRTTDGDDPCLRVSSSGRGNSRQNYVSRALESPLSPGRSYTVRFRAKWLRGCPLLLTRCSGNGLSLVQTLPVHAPSGSPGRRNGSWSETWPPVVGTTEQLPVAPTSGEEVVMTVRISSVAPVERARIHYRPERADGWAVTDLRPGGGLWRGRIPGQLAGRVEFYISARNQHGVGTFPLGAPERTALYGVDLMAHPRFATYSVLLSDRVWREVERSQILSNRLLDASVVFGSSRIVHGAGVRLRGSPWARGRENWKLEFGADSIDGRGAMLIDGQEYRPTNLKERMTFWVLSQLDVPVPRLRYVHLNMPGRERWNGVYEDVEKIDGDYLERWFEEGADADTRPTRGPTAPILHKIDGHWELPPRSGAGIESPEFTRIRQTFQGATLDFSFTDPEQYRWNYPLRRNGTTEDFQPLLELLRVLDPRHTPDAEFPDRLERVAAVDRWLRVLAARTAVNDWDSIGVRRGKNSFLYRASRDGLWHLLAWDADKSWSNSRYSFDSIFPSRLPSLRRLLSYPPYRRQYMSYLLFVAERVLHPEKLEAVLREFKYAGETGESLLRFAEHSRRVIRSQVPSVPFGTRKVSVVRVTPEKWTVQLEGTASLLAQEFQLDGHTGRHRFLDDARFRAEFELAPAAHPARLEVFDLAGHEIWSSSVDVEYR